MALYCDRCGGLYKRTAALDIFVSLTAYDSTLPLEISYEPYKNLCGDCAYKAAKAEYDPNYSEDSEDDENYSYDPDDPYSEEVNYDDDKEEDGEYLSDADAADIYMSSGEDEDYDFSDGGIDTSYYKDED